MKQFFKMFLASLLAMLFAAASLFIFGIVFFAALAGLSQPQATVETGSVLVFDMSVNVQDRPVSTTGQEFVDAAMGKRGVQDVSLLSLTRALRTAAQDDAIKGLLLTGSFRSDGYGSGFAALREVKEAVEEFAASGKPVWGYAVYPRARDMYVLSAARKIFLNPEGVINDTGMSLSSPFLGGFMKKYGIGVQVTRAGEFKAAAEPLVLERMSEPAREANQAVLDDFWAEYLDAIAKGAGIEPQQYADRLDEVAMLMADDALELGLVDQLAFSHTFVEELQDVVGKDEEGITFKQTSMSNYIAAKIKPEYSKEGYVAVIYAEGPIVGGEGQEDEVGSRRFLREIRQARLDDTVKALVLRVNSPGGSALASEVIQQELRLAQEKMPVVVSMGTLAASGGYWISTYADRIFAQPNTLTGSIGVIGIFFNFEELARNHGVNFDSVKTTRHAEIMSPFRVKTEEEMALVQRQVDAIYGSFLGKVSESRKLPFEEVERIAQGRIWSGSDALELGLVDQLGGLGDAIAYVGNEVGLGDRPAVKELPEPVDFFEELQKMLYEQSASVGNPVLGPLADAYEELAQGLSIYNDPKGVYAIMPYRVNID